MSFAGEQQARARVALAAAQAATEKLCELRRLADAKATPAELLAVSRELPGQIQALAAKVSQ